METKEVLLQLRKVHELTQEEMAKRLLVTRQAVSRWETGETIPNAETLKLISKEFHVSSIHFWGCRKDCFVSAAVCLWMMMDCSVRKRTAVSMKTTANGVIRTESLPILPWRNSWIAVSLYCRNSFRKQWNSNCGT